MNLLGWLLLGSLVGAAHLLALHRLTRQRFAAAPSRTSKTVALQALRPLLLIAAGVLAARQGAPALAAWASGVLLTRAALLALVWRRAKGQPA